MAADQGEQLPDLKSILIVDDDEVSRNLIANHLARLGHTNQVLAEDGEAAWQAIQTTKFDLIVLDWKLPKISGLALFNRIRRRAGCRTLPLLVVSGLLEKNDFRLLQEFPCTGLIEKPFTQGLFQNRLDGLRQETVWYGQNVALVDTILEAVERDGRKAVQLLQQVLKKAPNPLPLALLAARRLVRAKLLDAAETILEAVLKIDDESVIAMNELGKVLHMRGQHKPALDVLRRANRLSPQNLTRLCLTGEVELNVQDPESARRWFEQVLALDPDDTKAQAGVVVAGNLQNLLESPDPERVPQSFASLMNTMGITFVRNGQFAKGIEQYRSALAFLHGKDDSARVTFNLGLGFLRWGRPQEALPWFQRSESYAPTDFGRSAAYVRQLLLGGATDALGDRVREADMPAVSFSAQSAPPAAPKPAGGLGGGDGAKVLPMSKAGRAEAEASAGKSGKGKAKDKAKAAAKAAAEAQALAAKAKAKADADAKALAAKAKAPDDGKFTIGAKPPVGAKSSVGARAAAAPKADAELEDMEAEGATVVL